MKSSSDNASGAENQQERLRRLGWVVGFVDGEAVSAAPSFAARRCALGGKSDLSLRLSRAHQVGMYLRSSSDSSDAARFSGTAGTTIIERTSFDIASNGSET